MKQQVSVCVYVCVCGGVLRLHSASRSLSRLDTKTFPEVDESIFIFHLHSLSPTQTARLLHTD